MAKQRGGIRRAGRRRYSDRSGTGRGWSLLGIGGALSGQVILGSTLGWGCDSSSRADPTPASSSGGGAGPSSEAAEPAPTRGGPHVIRVVGRQLLVDDQPFFMRGVCWNPVPIGATHPAGLDYTGFAARDIALMTELGINVVRTYEPLLDTAVLDQLSAAGIFVIDSMYPWGGAPASDVVDRVRAVKGHPAILAWSVGNEWNYNGLYVGLSHADALTRLNEAAALIKAEDADHPVTTIYGELPDADTLAAMPGIELWGINAYRGLSFGDLFERWAARSAAPMFVSEYGADAYNANLPGYDPDAQALADAALALEILGHSSARDGSAVALGGTIFEWADEWWKDTNGSPSEQDVGGSAPGGGPYPDQVFNEEWWGVVDIYREPRPAFESLEAAFAESAPP